MSAPPKVSRSKDGAGRRAHILRSATTTIARLGFAGASLRELAAEAGMEKGHLTYYFPNKESLLFEIVDDLHRRFVEGIREWKRADLVGDDLLLHVFGRHIAVVLEFAAETRVAYDNFRFLTGPLRAQIVRRRAEYEQELADLIDSGRASSSIDPAAATKLLTKAVLGQLNWPYQWHSPSGPMHIDELSRLLAERALASLRPLEIGAGAPRRRGGTRSAAR